MTTAPKIAVEISAVDNASKELANVQASLKQINGPADRARESFGRFVFDNGLGRTAKSMGALKDEAFGAFENIGRIIPELGVLTSAGSIAGIEHLVSSWAKMVQGMGVSADLLNVPIGKLDAFRNAASIAGVSADAMGSGLETLNQHLNDAAFGRDPDAANFFNLIGVHGRDASQALLTVSDAVQKASDPVAKLEIATRAFGSAGRDLLPLLEQGGDAITEYVKRAEGYGTITENMRKNAAEFNKAQGEMKVAVKETANSIANALSPAITPIIKDMADWTKANREWIETGITGKVNDLKDAVVSFRQSGLFDILTSTPGDALNKLTSKDWWKDHPLPSIDGNVKFATPTETLLKPDEKLGGQLDQTSRNMGIDPAISRAVVHAESGGKMIGNLSTSAFGLFQLTDATAKDEKVDSHDVSGNIAGGIAHLKRALEAAHGDIEGAGAAYHDGLNSDGLKWLKTHPGDYSHFSPEGQHEGRNVAFYTYAEQKESGRLNVVNAEPAKPAVDPIIPSREPVPEQPLPIPPPQTPPTASAPAMQMPPPTQSEAPDSNVKVTVDVKHDGPPGSSAKVTATGDNAIVPPPKIARAGIGVREY